MRFELLSRNKMSYSIRGGLCGILIVLFTYKSTCVYGFSPIRKIIASHAVVSTLTSRIIQEIFNENVILQQLTSPHVNFEYMRSSGGVSSAIYCTQCLINTFATDFVYILFLGATVYARNSWVNSSNKLTNLHLFSKAQYITRIVVLVFLFVFTKDVYNAV